EAARLHATHRLGRLAYRHWGPSRRSGLDAAVLHLAEAGNLAPGSPGEHARLVAELGAYPAATLKALLPIALNARRPLCAALGWEPALPLVDLINATARLDRDYCHRDVYNSPDPTLGVLDVPAVRAALDRVDGAVAREILKLFRGAHVGAGKATLLLGAVAGW